MSSIRKINTGDLVYYLKKFIGLKGLVGFVAGIGPFVEDLIPLEVHRITPPFEIGSSLVYIILLPMVVIGIYSLRYLRAFANRRWISSALCVVLLSITVFCGLQYHSWQERVIRHGQVQPERDKPKSVCVIIGLERSEFAKQNYEDKTDEYMLRKRGWTREQVRILWTPNSVKRARRVIMVYFLAIPLLLVGMVSMLVLRECIDDEWGKGSSNE